MQNKKYALVAWTEKGDLRMVPSLVNEAALPYLERIEELEAEYGDVDDEIGWLLELSRAHEALARFYMSVDYPLEAYVEYKNAARVCSYCSDRLWLQGCHCEFPTLPLYYRFLAMHARCRDLARQNPRILNMYKGSDLESSYLFYTTDDRETDWEVHSCFEYLRTWRFGKES